MSTIGSEMELYHFLRKELPNKSFIYLNRSCLPKISFSNVVPIYYKDSFWFARVPAGKGVAHYFFGIKEDEVFNKDEDYLSLLFLKVMKDNPKSFVKMESGKIYIELISNENYEVEKLLIDNFSADVYADDQKHFSVIINKSSDEDIVPTIKKLINTFEFNLDLDSEHLIINNMLENKNKGLKINQKHKLEKFQQKVTPNNLLFAEKRNYFHSSKTNARTKKDNVEPPKLIFNIEKSKINPPSKYISDSDKERLRHTNDFFALVDNYERIPNYERILHKHFYEIIEKANSVFLEKEKEDIWKEFSNDLKNHKGVVTGKDKEKLKEKYDKGYRNYWNLSFDYAIDKKNKKAIEDEKPIVLKDFKERLSISRNIIDDSDRKKLRKEFNKDYFDFYDKLDFDGLVDDFNDYYIKNVVEFDSEKYLSQSDSYEISIDDMISKIDCNLFEGEAADNDALGEFEEFIESPIFEIIGTDLNVYERSRLIIKIKEDLSGGKISGDAADIMEFYFDQFQSIKKQYFLNNFLNDFVNSEDFDNLLDMYDVHSEYVISNILDNVRKDIANDDLMDEDKVKLKLEYYIKSELNKNHYFKQIDEVKVHSSDYMEKYNFSKEEFDDILNYIQIKITEGYHFKNVNNCIIIKINQKVDSNRAESRLKLRKLINDPVFIEKNDISSERLNQLSEYVGNLIYKNEIRSHEITEEFLLRKLRWVSYELY